MQTFMPYLSFSESLECLDDKRLGKQRVEALTILRVLDGKITAWKNHPAVKMWRDHSEALKYYLALSIRIWISRGFKNTIEVPKIDYLNLIFPDWISREDFHASHRSNLLRKDFAFYSKYNWKESPDLPYIWPV